LRTVKQAQRFLCNAPIGTVVIQGTNEKGWYYVHKEWRVLWINEKRVVVMTRWQQMVEFKKPKYKDYERLFPQLI
jgi:hypothetical protein